MIVAGDLFDLEEYDFEGVVEARSDDCSLLHPHDMSGIDGKKGENGEGSEKRKNCVDSEDGKDSQIGKEPKNVEQEGEGDVCQKCYEKNLELHKDIGWVYLSVVRTDTRSSFDRPEGNGMGMFMLRKHSSRHQAASRAFYDAGVFGWSTVFCCAIRADVNLQNWKGRVKCVRFCPHRVLVPEEGVLRVFL
jgi:hypothetical protein